MVRNKLQASGDGRDGGAQRVGGSGWRGAIGRAEVGHLGQRLRRPSPVSPRTPAQSPSSMTLPLNPPCWRVRFGACVNAWRWCALVQVWHVTDYCEEPSRADHDDDDDDDHRRRENMIITEDNREREEVVPAGTGGNGASVDGRGANGQRSTAVGRAAATLSSALKAELLRPRPDGWVCSSLRARVVFLLLLIVWLIRCVLSCSS